MTSSGSGRKQEEGAKRPEGRGQGQRGVCVAGGRLDGATWRCSFRASCDFTDGRTGGFTAEGRGPASLGAEGHEHTEGAEQQEGVTCARGEAIGPSVQSGLEFKAPGGSSPRRPQEHRLEGTRVLLPGEATEHRARCPVLSCRETSWTLAGGNDRGQGQGQQCRFPIRVLGACIGTAEVSRPVTLLSLERLVAVVTLSPSSLASCAVPAPPLGKASTRTLPSADSAQYREAASFASRRGTNLAPYRRPDCR